MHHDDARLVRLIEARLAGRLSRRALLRRGLGLGLSLPAISAALAACGVKPPTSERASSPPTAAPSTGLNGQAVSTGPVNTPVAGASSVQPTASATRFAVVGDFGLEGEAEASVANMVAAWTPEFVVTTGDNNYPDGSAATLDRNVGQYYHAFIAPYKGQFGPGATVNRFWPVLGNHDWVVGSLDTYLAYFTLPGNGRYYSVERGPIALFALDSMPGEPDGWTADSSQAAWLKGALAASRAAWKIVVLHHAPYSSGHHGASTWMRWPFAAWGAQLVLGGHDHTYERVQQDGITYVVNGLGGSARYARGASEAEGSQIFFNADHGAMLVEADALRLRSRFITRAAQLVDEFTLQVAA